MIRFSSFVFRRRLLNRLRKTKNDKREITIDQKTSTQFQISKPFPVAGNVVPGNNSAFQDYQQRLKKKKKIEQT